MNQGYEEFKIFVREFLSKLVTITEEYGHARSGEYYYYFSISEKKYALEISDGFCLYQNEYQNHVKPEKWQILWAPLDNDFDGLKNLINDLKR